MTTDSLYEDDFFSYGMSDDYSDDVNSCYRLEIIRISDGKVIKNLGMFDTVEEAMGKLGDTVLNPDDERFKGVGPVRYLKEKGIREITYVSFSDGDYMGKLTEMSL